MEGPPREALRILPKEIWLQIYGEIKSPQDKLNFLDTCPDINNDLLDQRPSLIREASMMIPQLQEMLAPDHSLNRMRTVSKGVNKAITVSLLQDRELKPWHDLSASVKLPTSIKKWKTSAPPFHYDKRFLRIENFDWRHVRGDTVLMTQEEIENWLDEHGEDDPNICPFPTKSLNVTLEDENIRDRQHAEIMEREIRDWQMMRYQAEVESFDESLAQLWGIVGRFQQHLETFKICCTSLTHFNSMPIFWEYIGSMLEDLPALKEFAFHGGYFYHNQRYQEQVLPAKVIPSLTIIGDENPISASIFHTYAPSATKLIVDVRVFTNNFIRKMQGKPLFQARELILINDARRYAVYQFNMMASELPLASFPNLVKLTVEWNSPFANQIMRILPNFPALVFFEMIEHEMLVEIEDMHLIPHVGDIPPIRFMSLPFKQFFHYDFLFRLVTIQELQFNSKTQKPDAWIPEEGFVDCATIPQLHEHIITGAVAVSDIWRVIPALQKVRIIWKGHESDIYHRT